MIDRTLPNAFIVESNELHRRRLAQSVKSARFDVHEFASAEEFIDDSGHQARGCIISGLRLGGMSGLELQTLLNEQGSLLPIILVSEKVSTPLIVKGMRSGALAFLDLPINEDELWLTIREAMAVNTSRIARHASISDLRIRFSDLSEGEKQVLEKVCEGLTNKAIASLLDVSIRTIESRRRRLLVKTRSGSFPELLLSFQQFRSSNAENSRLALHRTPILSNFRD